MIEQIDWEKLDSSLRGETLQEAVEQIAVVIIRKLNEMVDRLNELQPPPAST